MACGREQVAERGYDKVRDARLGAFGARRRDADGRTFPRDECGEPRPLVATGRVIELWQEVDEAVLRHHESDCDTRRGIS